MATGKLASSPACCKRRVEASPLWDAGTGRRGTWSSLMKSWRTLTAKRCVKGAGRGWCGRSTTVCLVLLSASEPLHELSTVAVPSHGLCYMRPSPCSFAVFGPPIGWGVCWQAYDAGKPPLKGLYIPVSFYNVSPAVRRPTVIVKGGRGRLLAPPRACHRDGRLRGRCLLCSPGRDGVRVTTQGHCQGGVRA